MTLAFDVRRCARRLRWRLATAVGALAVVMHPTVSQAQADAAREALPSVQSIYDRYADAVGGRAAWAAVTDRSERGTVNVTFAQLVGTYRRDYAAANRFRLTLDLGVGTVEQGTDGTVAWSAQPQGPPTLLDPADAAYVIESSATGAAFLDPTRFATAEVVGEETFDGVRCYRVHFTTRSGRERTDYFEVATGLRRGQVLRTPTGNQTALFRVYRAFEGKQVPVSIVQQNPQGDMLISISDVSFAPVDPSRFVVPSALKR